MRRGEPFTLYDADKVAQWCSSAGFDPPKNLENELVRKAAQIRAVAALKNRAAKIKPNAQLIDIKKQCAGDFD